MIPYIFSECIDFYKNLKDLYKRNTLLVRTILENEEKHLDITPPVLKDGQSIAVCSLYTGGLEICGVYPVQQFLGFMPKSYDELYDEMFTKFHGSIYDIPPRQLPEKKEEIQPNF